LEEKMASHTYEISERGDHSPFLTMEYSSNSGRAAQLYQSPVQIANVVTDQPESGVGFARGVILALCLEAMAGVGVYLLWTLWQMHR
jgi:hypothetical protein